MVNNKKGRSKLSFDNINDDSKTQFLLNRYIFGYISSLKNYFNQGYIKYTVSGDKIELMYVNKQSNIQQNIEAAVIININSLSTRGREEIMWMIQDFVINCYYTYEWNGHPISLPDIGSLLGIDMRTASAMIKNIQKKIKLLDNNNTIYVRK